MMKKMMILMVLLLGVCALITGCFGGENPAPQGTGNPGGIPTPGPTPESNRTGGQDGGVLPGMDGQNPMTATPAPGAAAPGAQNSAPYDWAAQASAVEGRIGLFSEIQECRVVADGGTALVGVRFAEAYRGELTQRIRDMIAGEVMAADNTIQVVAVTAEKQDVEKIFSLADQQRSGGAPADLKQQIDQIARNTTTLR